MQEYKTLIRHILENGDMREDRTGVGTLSVFGYQSRYDLQDGFPAVTIKKLAWKPVVSELLWFIEGSTDERRLVELRYGKDRSLLTDKRTIWTDNADKQGIDLGYRNDDQVKELGPVYGANYRNFSGVSDQFLWLLEELKNNPYSRRLIVSAWNPTVMDKQALPACHTMFQLYVKDNTLSCHMYQR